MKYKNRNNFNFVNLRVVPVDLIKTLSLHQTEKLCIEVVEINLFYC